MAQFSVHRNANAATRIQFPFLLDLQNDLMADLSTRLVIPLSPEAAKRQVNTLMPLCKIEGRQYALVTLQLAGIPREYLGEEVASLAAMRDEIVAALDLLITGF